MSLQNAGVPFHQIFAERILSLHTNDPYSAVRAEEFRHFGMSHVPIEGQNILGLAIDDRVAEFERVARGNQNAHRFARTIAELRHAKESIMNSRGTSNGDARAPHAQQSAPRGVRIPI